MSLTNEMKETAYAEVIPTALQVLRQELRERMEEFMDTDRFTLVIQPVVNFRDNAVKDGEVLSRLEHPERGVIFPDEFLPVINEMGLYPVFDRYIFEKSCVWLHRSGEEGKKFEILSCNFSRKTLSEAGIAEDLIQIADCYGIPHGQLGLEITEQEQATDEPQMIRNLHMLKTAGFRIILDDYGNGVTSEWDLTRYPVDILKIDRTLLWRAVSEQEKAEFRAMVASFMEMGAEVACEGIETEEQNRFVREIGCHYGQGFLYFKPIHQDDILVVMNAGGLWDDFYSADGSLESDV